MLGKSGEKETNKEGRIKGLIQVKVILHMGYGDRRVRGTKNGRVSTFQVVGG